VTNSAWGKSCLTHLGLTSGFLTQVSLRSLNVHSVHGPVINPYQHPSSTADWDARERRTAGGSSGGSAAAVAAGMSDA
jgi:aspartyl-tRNA(Asn)/glutamyl-tRNA(Gln) amidotransferase subunit A